MKKIVLLLFIIGLNGSCQEYGKLTLVTSLPNLVKEVSGMEMLPQSDYLWMVNDSGNAPTVYGYSISSEKIERSILLKTDNIDWEDLASDPSGNLYIGDFGNNNNKRKDLVIYTVKQPAVEHSTGVKASQTTFYFEDQKKFPPKRKNRTFDLEAFIYFKGHFYLFSKNRSSKFDGITKLYRLPAQRGHFKAELIGTFKTCEKVKNCQVTAAAIHHPTGKVALLSHDKVWIFSDYTEDNFFSGNVEKIKLGHHSQKESIAFKNATELYISDEGSAIFGGNLYVLSLD